MGNKSGKFIVPVSAVEAKDDVPKNENEITIVETNNVNVNGETEINHIEENKVVNPAKKKGIFSWLKKVSIRKEKKPNLAKENGVNEGVIEESKSNGLTHVVEESTDNEVKTTVESTLNETTEDKIAAESDIKIADQQKENNEKPIENVAFPNENVEVTNENVEVPHESVEAPHESVEVPHESVEVPHESVEVPHGNVEVLNESCEVSNENVELPMENGDLKESHGQLEEDESITEITKQSDEVENLNEIVEESKPNSDVLNELITNEMLNELSTVNSKEIVSESADVSIAEQ